MSVEGIRAIVTAVLAAIVVGLVLAAVYVVLEWRDAAKQLPEVQMRLAATLAAQETARRLRADVVKGYTDELTTLRAAAARPPRVVRVCNDPVPVPGAAAGGTDGAAAGAGVVREEPGRDIGPALEAKLREADHLSAQLRALQAWVSGQFRPAAAPRG